MARKKTRRVYRLRDLLKHAGFCPEWQTFVRNFETAEEVLTAVNSEPTKKIGDSVLGAAWEVRYAASDLADELGDADHYQWWEVRKIDARDTAVTNEERDRFVALWIAYADKHHLYETVSA